MFKNIIFALFALLALGISTAMQAAEQIPAAADTPVQATPSEPEKKAPADEKPAIAGKDAAMPTTTRPNNDKLVDYRYCLELKTDREIAECRYKK